MIFKKTKKIKIKYINALKIEKNKQVCQVSFGMHTFLCYYL